ncbi:hypothetical protein NX059_007031 [Plenodomus lindquistii]|nr:hypothetical protein NX059_007031 [Plenodomus lindquistii]
MPTYRSISISLHSQFDIETFPEYPPEPKEDYLARGITGFVPDLIDDTTSTCSVYVPVLPGSTFWINYSVEPPIPAGHHFLFKLYLNGAHIVSFSTGKEDGWQGKTMFGLFESIDGGKDGKRVEKRVFSFTPPNRKDHLWNDVADVHDKTACVEIRVHRSNGRKRTERVFEEYTKTAHAQDKRGVDLVSAGRAGPEQPKRFYKFALIDPIDQPFATFRYYYRTWEQLRGLGVLDRGEADSSEEDNLPIIEPQDASPRRQPVSRKSDSRQPEHVFPDARDSSGLKHDLTTGGEEVGTSARQAMSPVRRSSIRVVESDGTENSATLGRSLRRASSVSKQPAAYIPSGAPDGNNSPGLFEEENDSDAVVQRNSCVSTPPRFYRLSIPPSIRLAPPETASEPCLVPARRNESASSTSYRPHPAFAVDDWNTRTPSPVKDVRESIHTPPMDKASARVGLSWMDILPMAWRRRTVSGPSTAASSKGRDGARSVT